MDVFREKIQTVHIGDHFPTQFNGKSCRIYIHVIQPTRTANIWTQQNPISMVVFEKIPFILVTLLHCCYPRFSERLWQWDPVHWRLVRVGQKVPFIFSLLLTFRENLREREWKTKIMTRKVTWHYMAVSPCFSPYLSLSVFFIFFFFLTPGRRDRAIRYFVTRLAPQVISVT